MKMNLSLKELFTRDTIGEYLLCFTILSLARISEHILALLSKDN